MYVLLKQVADYELQDLLKQALSAHAPGTGTFHSRKSSIDDYVKDIETLSKDQLLEDGLDYDKAKK